MFVDSHCHLDCVDLADFEGSFERLIQHTTDAGIEQMLCVAIDLDSYPNMLALVQDYPQIAVSVGVHPMADLATAFNVEQLKTLASHPKVVALGETGLDYYYHKGDNRAQQDRFRSHIHIANELDKPVIVHTRDAGQDTLEILRSENAEKCGGVIHCFTETMEFADKALELGLMISFSGITTFKNAAALREVARHVPDENLLIETDSPYLAPVPHRGKQNRPAWVRHVAETLAEVRHTSVEHIAQITRDNYFRLFGHHS